MNPISEIMKKILIFHGQTTMNVDLLVASFQIHFVQIKIH